MYSCILLIIRHLKENLQELEINKPNSLILVFPFVLYDESAREIARK